MNSFRARLLAFYRRHSLLTSRFLVIYRRLPVVTTPLLIIVFAVLLGNVMFVTGLANNDPISWSAGISHELCRVTCGRPMIDPNVGYITQPFGHLSAMDLLHGHLPFWNYFEGLGQPLAGEMQGASLFPLTLLFALSSGLLWFHVVLEVIAGVSTFFLARRLSIPVLIATTAGILFALNGTFAWIGNAALNPVAFLPMLLLGIEIIFDTAKKRARGDWYIAALALALSLYAGFPEVAYLDGLFCAGWAIVRIFSLPQEVRLVAARRVSLAAVVGTVLSLPILIPFLDFLKVANVGGHVAQVDGLSRLTPQAVPMLLDPYAYGTILSNPNSYSAWGGVGGYFSVSVSALALLGLFGARMRPLRIFLALWTIFGLFGALNIAYAHNLWDLIPVIHSVAISRYIFPSCEMAVVTLAALGIMDFATSRQAKRLFTFTTLLALGLLIWSEISASPLNHGVVLSNKARIILMGLDAIPFLSVGFLLILGRFSKARVIPVFVATILVGEALLLFFVPTAESPKQITIDQQPLTFLRTNLGQERFFDFGVLNANWGSQFALSSLSAIDLPFPSRFANLIGKSLYPALTPSSQFVVHGGMRGIIAQQQAVVDHFAAYQDASVKYLLISKRVRLLPALSKLGVTRVFADSIADIYQMPAPRPFFSTTSNSCTVTSSSFNSATVNCPTGGATLVRSELAMAGWHASINDRPVPITVSQDTYQSVALASGSSTVTFNFMPPHEQYALVAALLAALFLIGAWLSEHSSALQRRLDSKKNKGAHRRSARRHSFRRAGAQPQ